MNRLFDLLAICFGLGLSSCDSNIPFEKKKWETHVDGFYPYRNDMLEDLLNTKDFKGKHISYVFEILGEHDDWCDHNMHELSYEILVNYGRDIDPVRTKYLVFELNEMDTLIDSSTIVTGVRIEEWEKVDQVK